MAFSGHATTQSPHARLLHDPAEAQRTGDRGHDRVVERYLGLESLLRYGSLIESLDEGSRVSVSYAGAHG